MIGSSDSDVPAVTQVAAADKATIEFTFKLDDGENGSPIKDGHVRLSMPRGWTPTNTTADADGTVTAFIDKDGTITEDAGDGDRVDLEGRNHHPRTGYQN